MAQVNRCQSVADPAVLTGRKRTTVWEPDPHRYDDATGVVGEDDVMAWVLLILAGLFETGFAVFLKQSHGITRLWPTAGFAVCALVSFALLTIALKSLEVGPAYAAWTGIGAAGTAAVGMLLLGDEASAIKLASIALILIGVIGLNLSGATPE